MILTFEQVQFIVKENPNKETILKGKAFADKLMMHIHGVGTKSIRRDYWESDDIYKERVRYLMSNKDVFGRLLQQEDMVFSARGGSTNFHLSDAKEIHVNEILDNVRFDMNLRKWIKNFALQAYRADPMGVIFMEVEQLSVSDGGEMNEPKAYPTYKSIYCIHDYETTGRKLEYIVFRLSVGECIQYGISDEAHKGLKGSHESSYYRVVDDAKDLIVQLKDGVVIRSTNISQQNPLPNPWSKTPGFIVSDLIKFNEPNCFVSPLDMVVELADCFLEDRSVRNLQKNYHGFSKAIEPLLQCPTCVGQGFVSGHPCPACTPTGADKGSGYKLHTKVSDVVKFPLDILESGSFDFNKIFGYVSPDIKGWEKQDASLEDLEELMEMTYWGTIRIKRPSPGGTDAPITATESVSNDAPKEARLNLTADWAERTESMVADFIGKYWLDNEWKKASISYGRDYILRTPEELMESYQTMRTKGAPDFSLDEALEKFYKAKYQSNPVQMQKYLKMLDVEPFPHISVVQAKPIITNFEDYNAKLYFGEWANTIPDAMWINMKAPDLINLLKEYVKAKNLVEPMPEGKPVPA